MELTVYETFEDFKENYKNDFPDYQGNILRYLKEYQILYENVFAESDRLDSYFHPRDESYEPLPLPEIVYDVNRKIFDLQCQQEQYYKKNSFNEEINETLYQFLLLHGQVDEFLKKKIQRIEIEMELKKNVPDNQTEPTAAPVDPQPDNRQLWEKICELWVAEYINEPTILIEFSYLYWMFIKDGLLERELTPPIAFRKYLSKKDIVLDRLKSESESLKNNKETEYRNKHYHLIKRDILKIKCSNS